MSDHPEDACVCGHRRFEHAHDGCAVRQMYGARYSCDCAEFRTEHKPEFVGGCLRCDCGFVDRGLYFTNAEVQAAAQRHLASVTS